MRDVRIIVLPHGWVLIGDYWREGAMAGCRGGACVIRRWGTTRGLGQIAKEGPTNDTKLDPQPETSWNAMAEVMTIRVNDEAWPGGPEDWAEGHG